MSPKNRTKKKRKRLIIGFIIFDLIIVGVYFALPAETRNDIFNSMSENGKNIDTDQLKDYISIQSITSRKAVVGDDWIIKGKIFNKHDSLNVSKMKLMFNFSDGVETLTLEESIPAGNVVAQKFKERISGHGDAEFESIDVLEAN
jgi:hypothetical protein